MRTASSAVEQPAVVVAKYGEGPWGRIDPVQNDDVFGPQSTGIPGVVRITYVPELSLGLRDLVYHR